ncbi:hypothetical protein BDR26DRAFT_854321, partial [Obelidium mucronatum]
MTLLTNQHQRSTFDPNAKSNWTTSPASTAISVFPSAIPLLLTDLMILSVDGLKLSVYHPYNLLLDQILGIIEIFYLPLNFGSMLYFMDQLDRTRSSFQEIDEIIIEGNHLSHKM